MIKAIVCCAKDYGIGKANGLLFAIPADMKHFRETTKGNVCVFGYNTYMSLQKRPLPKRLNLVLWDKASGEFNDLEGAITYNNLNQLIHFINTISKVMDVYICGGAMLYGYFIEHQLVDEVDITFVDAIDPETTAFFPKLEKYGYQVRDRESYHKDETTNGYSISKQIWVKASQESELIR